MSPSSSCSLRHYPTTTTRKPMSRIFWRIPVRIALSSLPSQQEARVLKSSMKDDDTKTKKMDKSGRDRDTRHVAFSAIQEVIGTSASADDDPSDTWYSKVDNEQFLYDTNIYAQLKVLIVPWSTLHLPSTFESTYNSSSSSGLTSSQVLQEYLSISTPQELIGIEHLLSAQKVLENV